MIPKFLGWRYIYDPKFVKGEFYETNKTNETENNFAGYPFHVRWKQHCN